MLPGTLIPQVGWLVAWETLGEGHGHSHERFELVNSETEVAQQFARALRETTMENIFVGPRGLCLDETEIMQLIAPELVEEIAVTGERFEQLSLDLFPKVEQFAMEV